MDFERGLSNRFIHDLWAGLTAPIQTWLGHHPIAQWLFAHPLWLVVLAGLAILLLVGLFGAIGRMTEKLWLVVLLAPFRLIFWGLNQLAKLVRFVFGLKPAPAAAAKPQERLSEILDRLELLRQEQDELLREVKAILAKDS